jgi:phage recombination protein Bet
MRPKNREATDEELKLFLGYCNRTGLDPFSRQIHAVYRYDKNAADEVLSIQTGIDGYRLIAERTGERNGSSEEWCGYDGQWVDVWLSDEPPAASRCSVYRKGCSQPFTGVALWREYAQTYQDGNPTSMWRKMPAVMLAKCAEAIALRKAFPQETSDLYTREEMMQADSGPRPATTTRRVRSAWHDTPDDTAEATFEPEPPEEDATFVAAISARLQDVLGVDELLDAETELNACGGEIKAALKDGRIVKGATGANTLREAHIVATEHVRKLKQAAKAAAESETDDDLGSEASPSELEG